MIPRILDRVFRSNWLITPTQHYAIQRAIAAKLEGEPQIIIEEPEPEEEPEQGDGYIVIPVHGILGPHLDMIETMCGGCDTATVRSISRMAGEDDAITTIVWDLRTPGGVSTMIPELGDLIFSIGESKNTIAIADSQCCSAGIWLAAQCKQFLVSGSGAYGSIGVYNYVLDTTEALAREGIKVESFEAGKHKLMGAPWRKLTDEERDMMQSEVDSLHADFKAAVRSRRNIPDEFMEGQVFDGKTAVEIGLADGFIGSVEELIESLNG